MLWSHSRCPYTQQISHWALTLALNRVPCSPSFLRVLVARRSDCQLVPSSGLYLELHSISRAISLLFAPCMLSVVPLLLGKSLLSCHCFQHGAKGDICIHRMLKGTLMAGSNDTRDHSRGASTLAFDTRGNATRFRHSVHERQMRSLSLSLPSAHRDSLQLVAATPSAPSRQRHRLLAARVPHMHAPSPSL